MRLTIFPEAGIYGMKIWSHPAENCGMYLLVHAQKSASGVKAFLSYITCHDIALMMPIMSINIRCPNRRNLFMTQLDAVGTKTSVRNVYWMTIYWQQ